MIRLELPWPLNNDEYYQHRVSHRGQIMRSRTLAAKHYLARVSSIIMKLKMHGKDLCFNEKLGVIILAHPPSAVINRPLDNINQVITDALEYTKVISNPSLIDEINIYNREPVALGKIVIYLSARIGFDESAIK